MGYTHHPPQKKRLPLHPVTTGCQATASSGQRVVQGRGMPELRACHGSGVEPPPQDAKATGELLLSSGPKSPMSFRSPTWTSCYSVLLPFQPGIPPPRSWWATSSGPPRLPGRSHTEGSPCSSHLHHAQSTAMCRRRHRCHFQPTRAPHLKTPERPHTGFSLIVST